MGQNTLLDKEMLGNEHHSLRLLKAVQKAQQLFIQGNEKPNTIFAELLDTLLALTESEFGFLAKVVIHPQTKAPYLKILSMTNIAWSEETSALYEKYREEGMEFTKLNSLYGHVIHTKQPYISNSPASDPHKHGTPHGHPPLRTFLGIPILANDALLGMIGIANAPQAYTQDTITFLEVFTDTCAVILESIRRTEEQKRNAEYAQSLTQSSSHYIIRTDLEGKYTYVNQGFIDHFDFFGKILGESSLESVHPEDRGKCTQTVMQCLQEPGKMFPVMLRKPLKTGEYLETAWEFIAVCDSDSVPYEIQCFGHDVSREYQQQRSLEVVNAQLAELNTHLEQRVAERTKDLRTLNHEKDEFMGIAAHDLKNPLSAIRLSAERIVLHHDRTRFEAIPSIAKTIIFACDRMLEIVSNLLELNRMETGHYELHPEWCSVKLIEEIVEEFQEQAEQKGISLVYDECDCVSIYADSQALRQIIDNLLSNAIKYSPALKQVIVRVLTSQDVSGQRHGRIEIQDEGEGIRTEDLQRLFTKFARLSSRPTGGENSTGLGLSIVKKLVELHKGKVWCESTPGTGSTFFVELPFEIS